MAYEGMQVPLRETADIVGDIANAFNDGDLTAAVGAVGNVPSELDTLREQNQRLAAQVEAQSGQMEFLESCLAEMAAAVYA